LDNGIQIYREQQGVHLVNVMYPHETLRVRTDCPDWQIWWVLRGGWVQNKAGFSTDITQGDVSIHAPGEPCRQRVAHTGIVLLGVQIPRSYLPEKTTLQQTGLSLMLARLQVHLLQGDAETLAIEESVARLFIPHASTKEQNETRWLRRVRDQLHDRFTEPIRLAELATDAGVHEVYLATAFRERIGCTIGEYLRGLRLEAALYQIGTTDEGIAAIACATGFYDHVGLPPLAFRQQIRAMTP
jgi:AraC-like DNA-binding protein